MASVSIDHLSPEKCTVSTFGFMWEFPTSVITNHNAGSPTKKFVSEEITLGKDVGKESSWKIVVNPWHMENNTRYISMHLRLTDLRTTDENNKQVTSYFRIALRHPEEQEESRFMEREGFPDFNYTRTWTLENNTFGWDKFMTYAALGPSPHPTMRFFVEINVLSDRVPIKKPLNLYTKPETSKSNGNDQQNKIVNMDVVPESSAKVHTQLFAQAWKSKWDNRMTDGMIDADVNIHTEDGVYPAHSEVLKANSPTLIKLMKSGTPHSIPCPDWSNECIEAILEYCYTGDLTKFIQDNETLSQLAELSASLRIHGLSELAREIILVRTNVENFTEVFLTIISLNIKMVGHLEDSEVERRERLIRYTKQDFVNELLDLRPKYPFVLMDYEKNLKEYAELIFEKSTIAWDGDDDYEVDVDSDDDTNF